MFRLKAAKDGNTLQYIPLIRKCFPALSIGEIRRRALHAKQANQDFTASPRRRSGGVKPHAYTV